MLDLNKEELSNVVLGDEFMKEYKEKIEILNEDETFTSAISYEDDQKYILNTEKWISFEEGKEKGLEQGVEQGINISVKNMYKNNIDIEQIAKILEISQDKIKQILELK